MSLAEQERRQHSRGTPLIAKSAQQSPNTFDAASSWAPFSHKLDVLNTSGISIICLRPQRKRGWLISPRSQPPTRIREEKTHAHDSELDRPFRDPIHLRPTPIHPHLLPSLPARTERHRLVPHGEHEHLVRQQLRRGAVLKDERWIAWGVLVFRRDGWLDGSGESGNKTRERLWGLKLSYGCVKQNVSSEAMARTNQKNSPFPQARTSSPHSHSSRA